MENNATIHLGSLSNVIRWCERACNIDSCQNTILNALFLNKMFYCALKVCKTPLCPLLPSYYFLNCLLSIITKGLRWKGFRAVGTLC